MIRWLVLAGLVLAAACSPVQPPAETSPQVAHGPRRPLPALGFAIPRARKSGPAKPGSASGTDGQLATRSLGHGICHVAPDGGPLAADRGIGGTGTPAEPSSVAERGIGGTGIVGVVTGFASVCVDGLEVGLDSGVPVDIDVATEGSAVSGGGLRAGQIVVISAGSEPAGLLASKVAIRHEVAGPIEAVEIGSGALVVAGQRVTVPGTAWSAKHLSLGDWIAVSGLRAGDGSIAASRLDPVSGRIVLVHGRVSGDPASPRIGSLALLVPAGMQVPIGKLVSVTGTYEDKALRVASLATDLLMINPPAFFGNVTDRVVIQSFVHVAGGMAHLSGDLTLPAARAVRSTAAPIRAIVWIERQSDGSYVVTRVKATDGRTVTPAAVSQNTADGSRFAASTSDAGPVGDTWPLVAGFAGHSSPQASMRAGRDVSSVTAALDLPLPPGDSGAAEHSDTAGGPALDAAEVDAPSGRAPTLATADSSLVTPASAVAPMAPALVVAPATIVVPASPDIAAPPAVSLRPVIDPVVGGQPSDTENH
jgi:hypothetical protein